MNKWGWMLTGAGAAVAIIALAGFAAIWGGAYNVAATDGHTGATRWLFHTAMENAVRRRAPDGPAEQPSEAAM